jgi:hypothetical protein
MVGVARSVGDDSSKGAQGLSSRLTPECEALRGRTVKLYQDNQTVCGALRKMSSKCRDQGPLVPWLHDNKIRLDVVYIRSEANLADARAIAPTGPRHVVLAATHATRALALGRVDIGLAGLHVAPRLLFIRNRWSESY